MFSITDDTDERLPGRAARLWGYGPIFGGPGGCRNPPGTLPPCFAPGSLHQAGLWLLSRRACARSYRGALDATMLCSIDRTGARRAHACPGDSGSPLAVRDGSEWVQVGVVSWAPSSTSPIIGHVSLTPTG